MSSLYFLYKFLLMDEWTEEQEEEEWKGYNMDSLFEILPLLEAIQHNRMDEVQARIMKLTDEQAFQFQEYMKSLSPDISYKVYTGKDEEDEL